MKSHSGIRKALIFLILLANCKPKPPAPETLLRVDSVKTTTDTSSNADHDFIEGNAPREHPLYFKPIAGFPKIHDQKLFVKQLQQALRLDTGRTWSYDTIDDCIDSYKKIKIFGSNKEYIWMEYDFHHDAGCLFPWKNQLLFDMSGRLIAKFWALKFRFINIVPHKPPMLLGLFSTEHGNGWHRVLRISGDTLQDIYDGFHDEGDYLETYDADGDMHENRPTELTLALKDLNGDGINDLTFSGKRMKQDADGRKIWRRVRYRFIYDVVSGRFKQQPALE